MPESIPSGELKILLQQDNISEIPNLEEMTINRNNSLAVNAEAEELFKWHLEKALQQVVSFANIIQDVITVIYGDFQVVIN